ncbi:MAG: hypothetical protein ACTMK5_10770, partial [Pseudomonas helleri]
MAVQPGPTFKRYAANGAATVYTIPFLLLDPANLQIILNGVAVTSGFTLAGLGNASSSCTFAVAPAGDLLFQQVMQFQRLTDYQMNGDFLSQTVNGDYDRLWLAIKQLNRDDGRALAVSPLEPEGIPALPVKALRTLKLLAFDAVGNPAPSNLTLLQLEQQPALALASAAEARAFADEASESAERSGELANRSGDFAVAADSSAQAAADSARFAVVASEAIQLSTGIFSTIANGLSATEVNGYFSVPSAESNEYLILYQNISGIADEVDRYPSASAIFSQNIWYDPFGETLFSRPSLGFGNKLCYFGSLNLVSASTPYLGKPSLTSPSGNVQRLAPLTQLGRAAGDTVRFAVDVHTDLAGPILSVLFRNLDGGVVGTYNTSATSTTPPAGRNILVTVPLVIPNGTSYIEVRVTGAGGAIELYAVACGTGSAVPKIDYSPAAIRYDGLVTTQKNLWPDPLLRQHQAGIQFHDGWGFAQIAGVALPGIVAKSNNSPFLDKNVIRLPTGAGQHDMNIDARRLGLRLGSKVTFVLAVYAAQSINVAIFGRNSAGAVVGDSSAVDYIWANGAALYEIRKTVIVDQVMLDTVKFFQVRLLNGRTVGATPVEICARGCFVGDTEPLLFDDCYEDDIRAIEAARYATFGENTLRETRQRLTAIMFGSAITKQLITAHIGDSYTHLPARWMQPFA